MPAKISRSPRSPRSTRNFKSLSAPATRSACSTLATRRSTRRKSSIEIMLPSTAAAAARVAASEAAGGGDMRVAAAGGDGAGGNGAFLSRLEQRIELLRVDARHQVFVWVDSRRQHAGVAPLEFPIQPEQLARHARRDLRQHGRQ